MAIRARVGRHTQLGGTHCQNWRDDQQAVIDLLNRISPPNGGAGGSLHPRIVAGIASAELYNAIVAFENKHFPGQHRGFFEPGTQMYQRLETLAAAAAAPAPGPVAPPPVPAPPAAPATPPLVERSITSGEEALLREVFKETLPYGSLKVDVNTKNWGGEDNSITPVNIPYMSTNIWCADFSAPTPTVSDEDRSTFIHEFMHVWQSYHGITKISYLKLALRHPLDYGLNYLYDLSDSNKLLDYNMEQQAAIIEDWWRITAPRTLLPLKNRGTVRDWASYNRFVEQVRNAGSPYKPLSLHLADSMDTPGWYP